MGGLALTTNMFEGEKDAGSYNLLPMDDGTVDSFMSRYRTVRRTADEENLIVSTNFIKRYTFDEVDTTTVVK